MSYVVFWFVMALATYAWTLYEALPALRERNEAGVCMFLQHAAMWCLLFWWIECLDIVTGGHVTRLLRRSIVRKGCP